MKVQIEIELEPDYGPDLTPRDAMEAIHRALQYLPIQWEEYHEGSQRHIPRLGTLRFLQFLRFPPSEK